MLEFLDKLDKIMPLELWGLYVGAFIGMMLFLIFLIIVNLFNRNGKNGTVN